jgi:hypothetical protein
MAAESQVSYYCANCDALYHAGKMSEEDQDHLKPVVPKIMHFLCMSCDEYYLCLSCYTYPPAVPTAAYTDHERLHHKFREIFLPTVKGGADDYQSRQRSRPEYQLAQKLEKQGHRCVKYVESSPPVVNWCQKDTCDRV